MEQAQVIKTDFKYNLGPCKRCGNRTTYKSDLWRCNGCGTIERDKPLTGLFIAYSTVFINKDRDKKTIYDIAKEWNEIKFVGGDINSYLKINKEIIEKLTQNEKS